ncbi:MULTISPECIES: ABC transporter permease [Bacillaceae]|uniref:ABC transporter permease n=1 Tax=Bacillaceae TaxID=186817 RepID=UPI00104C737C|nr:ABC transporter permease [Bacillus sp. CBEL-1]TDB51062.1 ABC transporter permease [Bacillus sp. CBEL-1]
MFLAFKEMAQSKIRYTLIGLIMIAVLFLVFFISGLANGLAYGDGAAIKYLSADYVVMNKEANGAIIKSELTLDDINTIKDQISEDATPLSITMMSSLVKSGEAPADVTYFSVNTDKYPEIEVIEGKNISELDKNEIIVDESLKTTGFQINDKVVDKVTGKEMVIAGFSKNQLYSNIPVVYTDLEMGLSSIYQSESMYNAVLYSGEKVDMKEYDTRSVNQTVKAIPGYKETQGSLNMIVVFLFIISAFVSTVFFYVITIHKLNQLGVLKAIGATTGYIAKSIMIQVILLTVTGLTFSSLLVYGMTQVIPEEMPFRLTPTLMLGTAALFLLLNLIGALLSVYQVAKTDALEAIGRVE